MVKVWLMLSDSLKVYCFEEVWATGDGEYLVAYGNSGM